ncbi:MAG: hydrogenase maturation protease [Acidobacteriota bacterium]
MNSNILIIGVGNAYRSDDAAGLMVVSLLEEKAIEEIKTHRESGEGTALIECWKDAETVFLIDAVSSRSQPGTIFRFDAVRETIPTKFFRYSTHAFSVAEAIELARTLDQLPNCLIVYGIEGANFDAGVELTPEVEKAVNEVTDRLLADILTIKKQQ